MSENKNIEINRKELLEESKVSSHFLNEMTNELTEQLNTLSLEEKILSQKLIEKENELMEKKRTKVYNINLFSPNHENSQDNSDVIETQIKKLKESIQDYQFKKDDLKKKIFKLKKSQQCLNELSLKAIEKDECEESNQLLHDMGLKILEAQESERQRIARDLHDSIVQNLTSLVHKAELCIKLMDIDSVRAKMEIGIMSNTIKTAINEMRDVIYNLKPMSLDDLGLIATVERYLSKLEVNHNIKTYLHFNQDKKEVLPVIHLVLFRIIQEACQNTIKHAQATLIDIDINYGDYEITISIMDNGIGFNYDEQDNFLERLSNFGLSIMNERIKLLSGTMKILTEKGKGTIVSVSVPLTMNKGD